MASGKSSAPNARLTALLDEAGWSPRSLAREINAEFGTGRVSETAPYHWRDAGKRPRPPLPAMTAAVLTRKLGRPVPVGAIWADGPDVEAARIELASAGMNGPWDRNNAISAVTGWLDSSGVNRRALLAVSGNALLRAVWAWLDQRPTAMPRPQPPPVGSGEPLFEHIETSIPLLQRLDDAYGGAAHLAYVEAQYRAVGTVLREGRYPDKTIRRLLSASATLGQLAGWMAFDANEHGTAQRHWFTALRAAREVGDRPLAAHILADLSFQAAGRNYTSDATVLGEAAARIAERSPATVRASVSSRLAYAYAAAGRRQEFETARSRASSHLDARNDSREPDWMYFLTPSHLDCQAGYALVAMGRRQIALGDRGGGRDISKGHALLHVGAHTVPLGDPSQRRALYEGAWLSLGHAALGDYQEACDLASTAVSRLDQVHSPRSNQILLQLAADLRTRKRNPIVRDYLPVFERTLGAASR